MFTFEPSLACNAVFQLPQGVHTLRNYGQKSNCSVSILFPQSIRVLSASVGMKSVDSNSSEINREVQNTNRSLLVDSKILDVNQSTSNGQEEKVMK